MLTIHQQLSILSSPLAVAVSGGADSMALLLLTHDWIKQNGGHMVALTVDHGLRKESAKEAQQVGGWCKIHGIEHHILAWHPVHNPTQEESRNARYGLLAGWCKQHHIDNLLTAHHRGDQAETLFFRLARGSHLRGLACISPVSEMDGIRLIRPLLNTGKKELVEYLREHHQPWIEDPSNQSLYYTRNTIRAALQNLPDGEEIETRAAAVADFFGRMRAVMEKKLAVAMHDTTDRNGIVLSAFRNLPAEIGQQLLATLIKNLNGDDHPPRSKQIERLYQAIMNTGFKRSALGRLAFRLDAEGKRIDITREHLKKPHRMPYSTNTLHIMEGGR